MVVHENQRVGIFIDVQNMYYSAKQLYEKKDDALKVYITEDIVSKMFDIVAIAEDFSDYLRGLIIKYPSK